MVSCSFFFSISSSLRFVPHPLCSFCIFSSVLSAGFSGLTPRLQAPWTGIVFFVQVVLGTVERLCNAGVPARTRSQNSNSRALFVELLSRETARPK